MKKEWLLLAGVTVSTLVLALGMIRWLAPTLLGEPADMRLVQADTREIPFFDAVFRPLPDQENPFLLPDPITRVRNNPLLAETPTTGPHDLLGFRNRSIPRVTDLLVIGDSQTYGNNVVLDANWPSRLQQKLADEKTTLYNMAVGGWCGVQYLELFRKGLRLRPRVVIVAFYTGNDALESFMMAYGHERWQNLRPDPTLTARDAPQVAFPPPASEMERISFADGTETILLPALRLGSNGDHPAIRAGYAILAEVGRRIGAEAKAAGAGILFALIPSKERVYHQRVLKEKRPASPVYQELARQEQAHAERLAAALAAIPQTRVVDLLPSLSQAAMTTPGLYPDGPDGHPLEAGYRVIGEALAPVVTALLPTRPRGLVAVMQNRESFQAWLITPEGRWVVPPDPELIQANGWPMEPLRAISERDLTALPILGIMERDPKRFGPDAISPQPEKRSFVTP
ncbi:MAG: SGNH/GDSL hydrolase family protein [Magnetococcales bacterium]|nr:SGNH/GDSL hydrolase family protein [Magnetococcales bacterium]